MKLRPLFDKVVLKKAEAVETTKGGILLPGSAQEKPQMSEVVAVGPGGLVGGKEVVMTLKVGDKVITGKYTGTEVKLDGVEYTIVSIQLPQILMPAVRLIVVEYVSTKPSSSSCGKRRKHLCNTLFT